MHYYCNEFECGMRLAVIEMRVLNLILLNMRISLYRYVHLSVMGHNSRNGSSMLS